MVRDSSNSNYPCIRSTDHAKTDYFGCLYCIPLREVACQSLEPLMTKHNGTETVKVTNNYCASFAEERGIALAIFWTANFCTITENLILRGYYG